MPNSTLYRFFLILQAVVLGTTALYFGQPVLIPLVVAALLTFLLRPAVAWLERRRVPRVPSVVLIVVGILVVMGAVGWIVSRQLYDLATHLDEYRGHIRAKMQWMKESRTDAVQNVKDVITEVSEAIQPEEPEADRPTGTGDENVDPAGPDDSAKPADDRTADSTTQPPGRQSRGPQPPGPGPRTGNQATASATRADSQKTAENPPAPLLVKIQPESTTPAGALRLALEFLSTPLATAAVVTVLVIFMLLSFEELRNRVLRLAGQSKLTLTTKTLDDVSRRISRYLMMNALVNGGFGLLVFAGLWLIGVDYSALWGFLAATLRFVPYVGPITAATLPISMAIVQFPGWMQPALVIGLFLLLELVTNNVIEPLAYGKSAGVSTVALLVAATFWTWLWGPMGLVLSVPLTVVLAVLGKHIPQFEPLGILLGDEPALPAFASFYQRLVAGDVEEATSLFEAQLAACDRAQVYDSLIIPALALAERDRHQGSLDEADKQFVWETARDLVESSAPTESAPEVRTDLPTVQIACFPAQDLADELALTMLSHVSPPDTDVLVLPTGLMASEKLAVVAEQSPDAVIVSALGPGGAAHVRYLCKRLRQVHPRLPIIVARFGYRGDRQRLAAGLQARGADQVVTTLAEALDAVARVHPVSVGV